MNFMRALLLSLLVATPAFAARMPTPTPHVQGRKSVAGPHHTATATATPTRSATPTATPTPIIPALCTHQAGVEFASTFSDGVTSANCPGFAVARLDLKPFTMLVPSTAPTQLAFDNVVSQGYNSEVDWSGFAKFTNPATNPLATLTLTAFIGPTSGPCNWTDPFNCGGLYSETTTWQIAPGQTSTIPFHEFIPAAYPQVIYMFLFGTTTQILSDCGVQYQSTECGGTVN